MSKPITKPIPVRIPKDGLNRIEAAAKKLGANRSRIVAFAVQKFTEYAENQRVVTMPRTGARFSSTRAKDRSQKTADRAALRPEDGASSGPRRVMLWPCLPWAGKGGMNWSPNSLPMADIPTNRSE